MDGFSPRARESVCPGGGSSGASCCSCWPWPQALVRLHDLHQHHERLWQALTDPAFTRRYWNTEFHTDWTAGSTMTWDNHGIRIADPEQVVLESEPYRRLSYTWHTFVPELGEKFGWSEERRETLAAEPRSKVTFEIEDLGQQVKLTVIHDGFEPGSTALEMVSEGWPQVLSGLKTLLETGETLPA
ncbi:SRPBCC family protein [Gandjariella thermophila]|nr:SRPBCC family protein [Gandjariella thermophila]